LIKLVPRLSKGESLVVVDGRLVVVGGCMGIIGGLVLDDEDDDLVTT
jgi:hypothetical protein